MSNVEFGHPLPPVGEESCRPSDMTERTVAGPLCAPGAVPVNCACDPGADGMDRSCGPNAGNRRCVMKLYCFHGSTCEDVAVTGSCVAP